MKRYHKVLFERDLPFRPKKEKSKLDYTRKVKHKNKDLY